MKTDIIVEDWGLIDYKLALERQKKTVQEVLGGASGKLIFCEHPAVLTMGRLTQEASFLASREDLKEQGVCVYPIDRGGDVTLHAPGQLVIYPILDLNLYGRDLKLYLEKLEQVAVDLLKDFGILAISIPGKRGVFVGRDKIISMGIGVRKWVCYHGAGINVNTDLSLFSLIKPCGLDVKMTSMAKLKGSTVEMGDVKLGWIRNFNRIFNLKVMS